MQEDKREVITREMLLSNFKKTASVEYVLYGIGGVLTAVLCGVFVSACMKELTKSAETRSDGFAIFASIIALVLAGLFAALVVKTVQMIRAVKNDDGQQILIERAAFLRHEIFRPELSLKECGDDVVYFEGGREWRIRRQRHREPYYPSRLSVALQLSEPGDTYIIVTMKSNPTEVLALYSEKFYVYKE